MLMDETNHVHCMCFPFHVMLCGKLLAGASELKVHSCTLPVIPHVVFPCGLGNLFQAGLFECVSFVHVLPEVPARVAPPERDGGWCLGESRSNLVKILVTRVHTQKHEQVHSISTLSGNMVIQPHCDLVAACSFPCLALYEISRLPTGLLCGSLVWAADAYLAAAAAGQAK